MRGKAAQTFEELHVYQRARELANEVYRVARQDSFRDDRGLVDQICRAAVSVMSNIAEGFERGSKIEFIQFLYIAKGSCGEVRAQLQIACDLKYLAPDQYTRLRELSRQTGGMISNFIASLQASDYQGPKAAGPQRQVREASAQRIARLREAQLVNIGRSAPSGKGRDEEIKEEDEGIKNENEGIKDEDEE